MPTVSVYFTEQDGHVLDAAKDLAKERKLPLSTVLATAVREYLGQTQEFQQITLRIGRNLTDNGSGTFETIRFRGRLLAEHRISRHDLDEKTDPIDEYAIYLTSKGRYLVVSEHSEVDGQGGTYLEYLNRSYGLADDYEALYAMTLPTIREDGTETPGLPQGLVSTAMSARSRGQTIDLDV